MKIVIVDDNGTVLDSGVENLQKYDLTKPAARSAIIDEIMSMVAGTSKRKENGELR